MCTQHSERMSGICNPELQYNCKYDVCKLSELNIMLTILDLQAELADFLFISRICYMINLSN